MTFNDSQLPHAARRASTPATRGHARVLTLAVLAGMLAGCASFSPPQIPQPLRGPRVDADATPRPADGVMDTATQAAERHRPLVEQLPPVATGPTESAAPVASAEPKLPDFPIRKPLSIVLDAVPLETFINVVYGMELGLGVQIDRSVRERPDLVSLSLTSPQPPEKVYAVAGEVLANYGVQVTELGGVIRFSAVPAGGLGDLPTLISSRSLPDVPAGQRTTFVAVPLQASTPSAVATQARTLFGSYSVTLSEVADANAVLISGPADAVRATMQAVLSLDNAALRGSRSIRINPLYVPADLLARELREVLTAQGISVRGTGSPGALTFVPVNSANALIIFAESEQALSVAAEWAQRLDQPSDDGAGGGMFIYSARHTTVESLVPVLQALIGATPVGGVGGSTSGSGSAAGAAQDGSGSGRGDSASARGGQAGRVTAMSGANGQLAIDPVRNVVVFQGDAQRWRAIQGVLARLDQPARQVVIEVTVAEVTLTDEFSNGVEWALRNVSINGSKGPLNLLKGASPPGSVVWEGISSSGQVKALVNLFAKDNRVSILSTPRLLVKSGESASIDVGTEVPIITSQATALDLPSNNGSSSILQSIQYRKTGVLLDIEAVVHSGQRVDLKVSQEVSEAATTDTSDISSPSIFSRRLQTSLSLEDGQSTLLGGLISANRNVGKTKVPFLGDIPVLGAAFQSRRAESSRTELLLLITPYVLEDAAQARAITDAVRSTFSRDRGLPRDLMLGDGLPAPRGGAD